MIDIKKEKIFLIHGVFMHGAIMTYMRIHLEKCGYDVMVFSYKSVTKSMSENAKLLVDFVQEHRDENQICHFVGHSLGGLLIRLAYEVSPSLFTGKIVTLGTPHNGSLVAKRIAEDLHRAILGGSYNNALDGELPDWKGNVDLGSLAGTACIGVGIALKKLPLPNDGTVSLEETVLCNQRDHVEVPLNHTSLVYSSRVVKQVDYFLQNSQFLHNENEEKKSSQNSTD